MIRRREDWQIVLAQLILDARDVAFAWGSHDCCLWSADVVMAISTDGLDLAADFRGTYSDAAGAAAAVEAYTGGGTVEDLAVMKAEAFGLAEVSPAFAWRGDVVLADADLGPCLGILRSDGEAAFVAPEGQVMRPVAELRRAWRVG